MGIRPSVPSVRLMMVGGGRKGAAANRATGNSASSPSSDQNEEVTKYILHEEWLADVCGVSRRRFVVKKTHHERNITIGVAREAAPYSSWDRSWNFCKTVGK